MGYKHITGQIIIDVFRRRETFHDKFEKINQELHITSANFIYHRFKGLLEHGWKPGGKKSTNYKDALRIYRAEERQHEAPEPQKEKLNYIPGVGVVKEQSVFSFILSAVAKGIDEYVDSRIDAKMADVRKELEQVTKALDEAKVGNWRAGLRQKLSQ